MKQENLTKVAKRALKEAEQRREKRSKSSKNSPRELHGRDGPDPARYGDWEKKGIAVDF